MSPTTLRCTVDGPVATIALARPDKLNALQRHHACGAARGARPCERGRGRAGGGADRGGARPSPRART